MKRNILFLGFIYISLNSLHAAEVGSNEDIEQRDPEKVEDRIVPNASYVAYSVDQLFRGVRVFYDADGNQLFKTRDPSRTIDPSASKPKIASFRFMGPDNFFYPRLEFFDHNETLIGMCHVKVTYSVQEDYASQFDFSKCPSRVREALFKKFPIKKSEPDGEE